MNNILMNTEMTDLVLDKDIICEKENISPKIYSPKTCMWVTVAENNNEMNKRVEDAKHII